MIVSRESSQILRSAITLSVYHFGLCRNVVKGGGYLFESMLSFQRMQKQMHDVLITETISSLEKIELFPPSGKIETVVLTHRSCRGCTKDRVSDFVHDDSAGENFIESRLEMRGRIRLER